jgi:anaerobic selenocysteine-containing dehydrogenase
MGDDLEQDQDAPSRREFLKRSAGAAVAGAAMGALSPSGAKADDFSPFDEDASTRSGLPSRTNGGSALRPAAIDPRLEERAPWQHTA